MSLTTTSGAALRDGGTYGVGTVIVAHFDEPIIDRTAAQRRLTVTTAPAVDGSWYWVDDQNAHWRPEHYYAAGTKITVAANIYGAPLGGGLYGQEDQQTSFTIGDSHVSIADDNTKQVNVYNNGVLVRTMPTSMGMGGTQTVAGQTLTFWTPPGVYTVMDKSNPVVMDSSTYGLPVNSHLGYRETINYATRISPDGIYLHQLDSTVWARHCRCRTTVTGVCPGRNGRPEAPPPDPAGCSSRHGTGSVNGSRCLVVETPLLKTFAALGSPDEPNLSRQFGPGRRRQP